MKNVTRQGDVNSYYIYRGMFITRDHSTGYYSTYTTKKRLMADTQKGIMQLIREATGSQHPYQAEPGRPIPGRKE